ncbi:unnamed protein product [Arabis nemorensis]|uniref:Uncharacterized protein n=1 Tax=Arabis nemorensis TaxID=586526 RepID=A0A565BU49_9BRAS|nr:unnamed protein product [Arabis nemorensis]
MALPYDPDFTMAYRTGDLKIDDDVDHDASVSAAIVAVDLISSARLSLKLDTVYTEYSAQYLVDNARSRQQRRQDLKLTVKDCLKFVLNKGIPKAEDWPHLGSVSKPPSSYKPALVSMKGQVIETRNVEEARDWLMHQPVGAKLHVFSPHIDLQQDAIYCGSSGEPSGYVGLRDGIIVEEQMIGGKSIAIVKLWYKNSFRFVNVAMSRMFADYARGIEPTTLLADYCVPRLSIH